MTNSIFQRIQLSSLFIVCSVCVMEFHARKIQHIFLYWKNDSDAATDDNGSTIRQTRMNVSPKLLLYSFCVDQYNIK